MGYTVCGQHFELMLMSSLWEAVTKPETDTSFSVEVKKTRHVRKTFGRTVSKSILGSVFWNPKMKSLLSLEHVKALRTAPISQQGFTSSRTTLNSYLI